MVLTRHTAHLNNTISFIVLSRHKKYQERKKKYSPSDAVAANKDENRDAIQMDILANTAALQQDAEGPVATTGTSITTASSSTTTTGTATTGPTGVATSTVVDPFNVSEDQIRSRRGLFSFSRVTGSFSMGGKK